MMRGALWASFSPATVIVVLVDLIALIAIPGHPLACRPSKRIAALQRMACTPISRRL